MTDWAHDGQADGNRRAKAAALVEYLTDLGFIRGEVAAFGDPDRRQMEREAGVNRGSNETWDLVLESMPAPTVEPAPDAAPPPAPVTVSLTASTDPDQHCWHWEPASGYCGTTEDVHPYLNGLRCARHHMAALRDCA